MIHADILSWRSTVALRIAGALFLYFVAASFWVVVAGAQSTVERRLVLRPGAALKMFVPEGSLHLVGTGGDTLVVLATLARGSRLFFGGGTSGAKMEIESEGADGEARARVEVRVPRGVSVSVKTVGEIGRAHV